MKKNHIALLPRQSSEIGRVGDKQQRRADKPNALPGRMNCVPRGDFCEWMYYHYAYVNNNPINLADPSGNRACEEIDKNGKYIVDAFGKEIKNGEFSGKLAFTPLPIGDVTWEGFQGGTNFAY